MNTTYNTGFYLETTENNDRMLQFVGHCIAKAPFTPTLGLNVTFTTGIYAVIKIDEVNLVNNSIRVIVEKI
ncbi:MAG: hypothetical protein EKK57_04830 [Proteobacteria bacterium]|nr:MAG: hypothetical protein EKK57_04830 [Pseudomonadota bacterium]